MLDAKAAQRAFETFAQEFRRIVEGAHRRGADAALGGDHEPVAMLADEAANDFLRHAVAIDAGGVEMGDAQLQRAFEGAVTLQQSRDHNARQTHAA